MCGIYGSIGIESAEKVFEGLMKLEYRGYDSAGLSSLFPQHVGPIKTEKTVGFVSDLVSKANGRFKGSHISIGHTRWATHGDVNQINAHPHSNEDGDISIVHNGIIENSVQLSQKIEELGYIMNSETDTEVIVHLLDYELKKQTERDYLSAFENVIAQLEGSWAIAVIISGMEGILISRKGAPLVIGKSLKNMFISSDAQPLYGACSEIAYLNDGDNLLIKKSDIISNSGYKPEFTPLEGVYDVQNPGRFKHMMMKEIQDQPNSLSNVFSGRISPDGLKAELNGFKLKPEEIKKLDKINLVSCGTAYYASIIIAEYIREFTSVPVEAFIASEFPAELTCSKNTLTIGITQSGETKDTLDALFDAKKFDSHISSICNVIGSTIARFTGNGAYLYAGQEYAVASTKVYTNMLATGLLFALTISDIKNRDRAKIINDLRKLPNLLASQLVYDDGSIAKAKDIIKDSKTTIFLGRGQLMSKLAQEGALKMMEVTYIPCLAYPSGELKHGPIALIEEGTPVVAIAPADNNLSLIEANLRECKSRGAKIIVITDHDGPITQLADVVISTPSVSEKLLPFVNIIPLQLLAYNVGVSKKINVDRPRNLAKSVTVV